MTQEELNQADYGAKGVPPSTSASLREVRRRADSFRPKGQELPCELKAVSRMKNTYRDDVLVAGQRV
jgi:hypothetical protein